MKYIKKAIPVECHQWFQNGDHPNDHLPMDTPNPTTMDLNKYSDYLLSEGKVVKRYNHPRIFNDPCVRCGNPMHKHGWIDTLESVNYGQLVCPGDWIITGVQGEYCPCKPNIFAQTYELYEDIMETHNDNRVYTAANKRQPLNIGFGKSLVISLNYPLDGYADNSIVWPYAIDDVTPNELVPASIVPTYFKTTNNGELVVPVRPILFNKPVDLLAISNPSDIAKLMSKIKLYQENDTLDKDINIGPIFYTVTASTPMVTITKTFGIDVLQQPGLLVSRIDHASHCDKVRKITMNLRLPISVATPVNGYAYSEAMRAITKDILDVNTDTAFHIDLYITLSIEANVETGSLVVSLRRQQIVLYDIYGSPKTSTVDSHSIIDYANDSKRIVITPVGYLPIIKRITQE